MSLAFLEQRLSVPSRLLGDPGPDPAQLDALLGAAIRVPDHGVLTPWRLLLIRGDVRQRLGEELVRIHREREPDAATAALDKDRQRFSRAPLVVAVIARLRAGHKIPEQEQLLSAGCVAYNLLLGAQALGFGAQWLTGWAAYDGAVAELLGLGEGERIVGFVHVGTPRQPAFERPRPTLSEFVQEWTP
jgi:nitroreductase